MIAHRDRSSAPARRKHSPHPTPTEAERASGSHSALARALRPGIQRPADVLALQRVVGNRAVVQLLAPATVPPHATVPVEVQGVIQRVDIMRTSMNSPWAAMAKRYRKNNNEWAWEVNVAAIRFKDAAGTVIEDAEKSAGPRFHAEHILMGRHGNRLNAPGREEAAVYTERYPCGGCQPDLNRDLRQEGDVVFHTNDVDQQDGSNPRQENMIARWRQEFDAEQAQMEWALANPSWVGDEDESAAAPIPTSSGASTTGD